MVKPEMGQREPEQIAQEEYSVEQSKADMAKDIKEMQEGKIDINEFTKRTQERERKLQLLIKTSKKRSGDIARKLGDAIDNFDDVINREI